VLKADQILMLFSAALFAGGLWITVRAIQPGGDVIGELVVYPSTKFDSVDCPVDQSLRVEFRVQNTSNGTIKLLGLETGCGCTRGTMSAKELQHGDKAVITLQLDARKSPGPFGIAAVLQYIGKGDGSPRSVTLTASGRFVGAK